MGLGVPIGRIGKMKRGEAAQLARLQGCARRGAEALGTARQSSPQRFSLVGFGGRCWWSVCDGGLWREGPGLARRDGAARRGVYGVRVGACFG